MSRAKRRGALLIVAFFVAIVAVAIFATPEAWFLVPSPLIALAFQLAAPIDDDPDVPNSPVKVWLFAGTCFAALVLIVLGFTSKPVYLALGAGLLCLSVPGLWMIRQGRNPWWMRGWADYAGRR